MGELERQMVLAYAKRIPTERLEAHLFNLALERCGIIDYTGVLEETARVLYEQHRNAFDEIVQAVADAINRRLGRNE